MWGGRALFPMLRNQGIPSTRETGCRLLVVILTAVRLLIFPPGILNKA